MKRSTFIASLTAVAVSPLIPKTEERRIERIDETTIRLIGERGNIAIDLGSLKHSQYTAAEILEMFFRTGVLIYVNPAPTNPDYSPITLLPKI